MCIQLLSDRQHSLRLRHEPKTLIKTTKLQKTEDLEKIEKWLSNQRTAVGWIVSCNTKPGRGKGHLHPGKCKHKFKYNNFVHKKEPKSLAPDTFYRCRTAIYRNTFARVTTRQCELPRQFNDNSLTVCGTPAHVSVPHIMPVLVLLPVVGVGMQPGMIRNENKNRTNSGKSRLDATRQLSINNFRPFSLTRFFPDISMTFSKIPDIPWQRCQIPWHFHVFQTSGHPLAYSAFQTL